MKRFLLLAALFVTSAVFASAQEAKYTDYYVTEEVGQESASMYWIRIDWDNKFFFIDGDNHNDGPIKNYKESGNKRTFDAWYAPSSGINKVAYKVVFVSDGDDKYTITLTIEGYTTTFKCTTKKPGGAGGGGNAASDKIQAMKEKIGHGINKGIDAMKKKQEENKAKKEAKKEANANE